MASKLQWKLGWGICISLAACNPQPPEPISGKTEHIDRNKATTNSTSLLAKPETPQSTTIPNKDLYKKDIPKQIAIKGNILLVKSWADTNGKHILLATSEESIENSTFESYGRDKEILIQQWIQKSSQLPYEQLWKIYDQIRDCEVDLTLDLVPNATQITDLDKDGVSETTVIYWNCCAGDVSPSTMYLIMHENNQKYTLEGLTLIPGLLDEKVDYSAWEPNFAKVFPGKPAFDQDGWPVENFFGRYKHEEEFRSAPKEFLLFARDHWKRFMVETYK